jgi:hypothetical protein
MNTFQKAGMNTLQKAGGIAALAHALAYLIPIAMAVTLIFPILDGDTAQYIEFVRDNQFLMHIWILISYWGSAISLVIMAIALFERLKADSTGLIQIATAFGIIWAGLIIGSGNLMLNNFHVITDLYATNPALAATAWTILEAVENGITSGNELVGSLWVLLLSFCALRHGGLPKALSYAGIALAITGICTLIPDLTSILGVALAFGLGMVVWSTWLGIVLLRSNPGKTA